MAKKHDTTKKHDKTEKHNVDKWTKHTFNLPDDHSWKAPEGYNVFITGRGAVQFNVPQDWVVEPDDDSVKIKDKPSPTDTMALAMSYYNIAEAIWAHPQFPMTMIVKMMSEQDGRNPFWKSDVHLEPRQDLEQAWLEIKYIDPLENCEAQGRWCLVRGKRVVCLNYRRMLARAVPAF
ncbi:MAG: hypothetical protein ACRCYY_08365 [Trueperaceae bacterium]